jgi:hypothetical protein
MRLVQFPGSQRQPGLATAREKTAGAGRAESGDHGADYSRRGGRYDHRRIPQQHALSGRNSPARSALRSEGAHYVTDAAPAGQEHDHGTMPETGAHVEP